MNGVTDEIAREGMCQCTVWVVCLSCFLFSFFHDRGKSSKIRLWQHKSHEMAKIQKWEMWILLRNVGLLIVSCDIGKGINWSKTYTVSANCNLHVLLRNFYMLHVFHVVSRKLKDVSRNVFEHGDQEQAHGAVNFVLKNFLQREKEIILVSAKENWREFSITFCNNVCILSTGSTDFFFFVLSIVSRASASAHWKIKQFNAIVSQSLAFVHNLTLSIGVGNVFCTFSSTSCRKNETAEVELTQFSRETTTNLQRWYAEYKCKDLSKDEDTDSPRSKVLHRAPSAMGAVVREPCERWKNDLIN